MGGSAGFVAIVLMFVLAWESGYVPWAILMGIATGTAVMAVSRKGKTWKLAILAGILVMVAVSILGVFDVVSPGWYTTVL